MLVWAQVVWTYGVGYVKRVDELNVEISKLELQFHAARVSVDKLKLAIDGLQIGTRQRTDQDVARTLNGLMTDRIDAENRYFLANDHYKGAQDKRAAVVDQLNQWSNYLVPWSMLLAAAKSTIDWVREWFNMAGAAGAQAGYDDGNGSYAGVPPSAESDLRVMWEFVLPMLYGLIGALAFILRTLVWQVRNDSFTPKSSLRFRLRWPLGMLAGIAVGWFSAPATDGAVRNALTLSEEIGTIGPFALAFLAGFSVEVLFTGLDRLVSTFTGGGDKRA